MSPTRRIAAVIGGLSFGAAAWLIRTSIQTEEKTRQAVETEGTFDARLTGYWPFSATSSERRMEGGKKDRKGSPLHTLEQHDQDPQKHPYIAVSGDDALFPYGQRITIDAWPGRIFRVVDTGDHFRGARK